MGARLSERIIGLVNAEPYEDEGLWSLSVTIKQK